MNKTRRDDLETFNILIHKEYSLIENDRDEEQKYYDNMPEAPLQNVEG